MDVPRYDADGSQTSVVKGNDYRRLLPIPQSEYKYNRNITEANQNPGWSYEKTE